MDKSPLRVLLVEDSPSDAELLRESLAEDGFGPFVLTHVESWAQAAECLKREVFDVLLLDLTLPDVMGRETFLVARAAAPQLPIVVLTGFADEAMGLEALREGIQDYLLKGKLDASQLVRAIRYAIERKEVESELQRARDKLESRVQERTADLKQTIEILQTQISYRQVADQALRESEERYRSLFEAAPVGIGITDERGHVLAFNRRLCAMIGMTPEEARTTPTSAIYAEPAEGRRFVEKLRQDGKVEQAETRLRRKDGTLLVCLLHMEEIRLGSEKLIMTIVQDITRQKQTERHLEGVAALLELFATRPSRKEYLRSVVGLLQEWCDCLSVGIRLLDQHGRLPYAAHTGFSRSFLRQESGFLMSQMGCACLRVMQGQPQAGDGLCCSADGSFYCNETARFLGPGNRASIQCASLACVKAGYQSVAQAAIRYHEEILGTVHLADPRAGQFPIETVRFIESVAPLIGEAVRRFQVEEALRESEARFRSMFERHNAIMLLVLPKTGALMDANPAAVAFYGQPRERLCAMNIADLCVLPGKALADYRRRAMQGHHDLFVCTHRLASGALRTVEVHSSPIEMKGERLLFSIIHDITERKLLERQVLEAGEQERQRLGQDLHDSLAGQLTGVALMGKALAYQLGAAALPQQGLAEELVQRVNDSIRQARAISHGLCPVELGAGGLSVALAEFVIETQKSSGLVCNFELDGDVQISDLFVATHLFQIAREAVTNTLRHGLARNITIRLMQTAVEGCLEIRDDGKGMPAGADGPVNKGLGLRTMNYRAGALGGQLEIHSAEDGTVIRCRFPVQEPIRRRKKIPSS